MNSIHITPGIIHRTNAIEASANLTNWLVLTNILNKTGRIQFTDPAATNHSQRFYRARLAR